MWRRWPLPFFSADAGGGGGGDPAPAPAPAAVDPPTPVPPAADPPPAPAAPVRPDWLPETAWDATAGKPTVDVAQLLALKQQADERAGQVPEDPAGYKAALPEGFALPEGIKFEVADSDPLLGELRTWAKETGLSQAQFSQLIALRAKMDVVAHEAATAAMAAELGKLGDKAKDRVAGATAFLKSKLPADQFEALYGAVTSAKGVEAIESLMTLTGGPKLPSGGAPSTTTADPLAALYPSMKKKG